jgi:phosphohistidine phosphatase
VTHHPSDAGGHRAVRQREMICYFVRHAEAEPALHDDDAGRPLTKAGRHDAREIFAVLAAAAPSIGRIYSSPLLRARQTAELLSSALQLDADVEISSLLASGGTVSNWTKFLIGVKHDVKSVAAVGHEPVLGRWIGELCFGIDRSVVMKKCAVAKVRILWHDNDVHAELQGLYQPGFMRKLTRM